MVQSSFVHIYKNHKVPFSLQKSHLKLQCRADLATEEVEALFLKAVGRI